LLGPWHGLGGPSLLGTLLCLGPGVCYGLAFAYTRRHPTGRPEPVPSLAAGQVLLATLQLALVTPFFPSAPAHTRLKVWGCRRAPGVPRVALHAGDRARPLALLLARAAHPAR